MKRTYKSIPVNEKNEDKYKVISNYKKRKGTTISLIFDEMMDLFIKKHNLTQELKNLKKKSK